MNKNIFFWFLTILFCTILQIILSKPLSIQTAYPHLLLLSTIFFAVRGGAGAGEWTGFVWGILADVASISLFGSQTFMLTLIGYLCGRLQGKIDEEKPMAQMGLVFLMSLFYIVGLLIFENVFSLETRHHLDLWIIIVQPIYSTLVSPLFFWLLTIWCSWLHKT